MSSDAGKKGVKIPPLLKQNSFRSSFKLPKIKKKNRVVEIKGKENPTLQDGESVHLL